jgi:hypothetical protein
MISKKFVIKKEDYFVSWYFKVSFYMYKKC